MKYGEVEKGKWYYDGMWDGKKKQKHYTYIMKALSDRFYIDDPRDGECAVCKVFKIQRNKSLEIQGCFYLWQSDYDFKVITDEDVIEKLESVYEEYSTNPNRNKLEKFVGSLI